MNYIQAKVGPTVAKLGHGEAMRLKWISQDKTHVARNAANVEDTVRTLVKKVKDGAALTPDELNTLKRRRMTQIKYVGVFTVCDCINTAFYSVVKTYKVTKGPKYTPTFKKVATDLTAAMISSYVLATASCIATNIVVADHGKKRFSSHITLTLWAHQLLEDICIH